MSTKKTVPQISRKEFICQGALGAVGLGLSFPRTGVSAEESKATGGKVRVVLARDAAALTPEGQSDRETAAKILETALCGFTDEKSAADSLRHFVKPGDTVGIKISLMMTPTHPELVAALIARLIEAGIKEERIIVWDRDTAGTGLDGAYKREKHYGYGADSISRIITEEATALINMPALKSHWLSGMAAALKNWAGAFTRINVSDKDTPYPFHQDSCADLGLLSVQPPIREKQRLVIVDAYRPLYSGGPQVNPDYLWNYGGIFLGQDPVAVDFCGLKLIHKKRELVKGQPWPVIPPAKHIALADTRYKLGCSDESRIELVCLGEEKDRLI